MIKLLNMDCMSYMKTCKDNEFDLCITSPPYNIGATHHTGNVRHSPYKDNYKESEYQDEQILVMNELYRIIYDKGSLFYNHKNRIKDGLQISPYEWIFKTEWKIKQELVWVNGSQNFDGIRFYPKTERIYWLVKNSKTIIDNKHKLNDYIPYSVWPSVGVGGTHSRAFPLKMVHDLLHTAINTRRMIDPYMGTGTSAIAAHYHNIDFVGTEIDKDYYDAACKRFKDETAQESLF